jgi:hypothetical protein
LLCPFPPQFGRLAGVNHLLNHAINSKAVLQGLVSHFFPETSIKIAHKASVVSQQILVNAPFAESVTAWSGCAFAKKLLA